jgi:hypothetical protein
LDSENGGRNPALQESTNEKRDESLFGANHAMKRTATETEEMQLQHVLSPLGSNIPLSISLIVSI